MTGLAVLKLVALNSTSADVKQAIAKATAWLAAQQRADGSFGGGPTTSASNSNSTGVAGWALATPGRLRRRGPRRRLAAEDAGRNPARRPPLDGEQGAVAYDENAFDAGKTAGITAASLGPVAPRHGAGGAGARPRPRRCGRERTFAGPKGYQRAGSHA